MKPNEHNSDAMASRISKLFDDSDFYHIHSRMSLFNIFEAVGAPRSELRHSNFLAYLLSPNRPHGLRSRPLSAMLRDIVSKIPTSERPITTLELIAGELDDAIIHRERNNIDILIELPTIKLVVAIENKVGAKASEGQLERYSQGLKGEFPDHRRILVFLTPDGTVPDHDHYVAYNYQDITHVLEALLSDALEPIPEESALIVRHYIEMVRRHVVQDETLRELALALYERHKEAFDFIFECKPQPANILSVIRANIDAIADLREDSSGSNLLRFFPDIWDQKLGAIKGDSTKWSKTGRGLLFECKTYASSPGRVNLALILGPGDPNIREQVYKAALAQSKLFVGLVKPMGKSWATIFSRDLLTSAQAKGLPFEAQQLNVGMAWSDFQAKQLKPLIDAVLAIDEKLRAESH